MPQTVQRFVNAFPLWVLAASLLALVHPPLFTWFRGPCITGGLGVIMLAMGLSLELADFGRVAATPKPVIAGVVLQYTVMPALGTVLATGFDLPKELAVGLILVACCPGGTASNVVTYLAGANVALSVTMTALSTVAAIGLTPWLTTWLVGSRIPVDPWGLLASTVTVIVLPIAGGLALRHGAPKLCARLVPVAPIAAVLLISMIVASIVGEGRDAIFEAGPRLLASVVCLHAAGFSLGYALARCFVSEQDARTISIEVGMQNSGLGVVLARQNFANPWVAIPAALSSLVHSLLGSLLAGVWRSRRCRTS